MRDSGTCVSRPGAGDTGRTRCPGRPSEGLRGVWAADGWVRPFFKRYRKILLASLGLGVAAAAFASALMFSSGYLISASAEQPPEGIFVLLAPLACVQVFGLGRPFLNYLERLVSHDWVLRMTSLLRLRLYRAVEGRALFWTGRRSTGEVLGLLDDDIGHIQDFYLRSVFPTVVGWALWALAVALLGLFSPLFALFMLLDLGVVTLLAPLVSVAVNGARRMRAQDLRAELYAEVTDDVLGLADWVFSQRAGDCVRRVERLQEELGRVEAARARSARRRDLALQVVLCAGAVGLLVWTAFTFADPAASAPAGAGVLGRPADWVAAFLLAFFPLTEALTPLSDAAEDARVHLGAIGRLNDLEDAGRADAPAAGRRPAGERAGGVRAASEHTAGACADGVRAVDERTVDERMVASLAAEPALEVRLAGVRFAYPAEGSGPIRAAEVLRGVDLVVAPGEKVAVLGPSGAGKSTLLSVIRGDLAPAAGSVAVGGADPRTFGEGAAHVLGVIQQSTYLFNATLLDNLRLGNPAATEDDARRSLEAVGLSGLLGRLPDGLATMVDETGMRFSGGERHRIALARVLLGGAPVVLLDEPTVSLDPLTEHDLLDTVFDVLADRTVIMVTHHLLGVAHVDRVVFLEGGRVALDGAPSELERTSERYRRLVAFDRGV